jgi:uncharacterized protein (UPF0303 family)
MKPNDELVKILLEHEKLFVFPSFDAGTAWALGSQVRKAFTETPAAKSGKGVVIAIELFTGHTLFRTAVGDGVTADNWCVHSSALFFRATYCEYGSSHLCIYVDMSRSWVTRKLNTVRRFEKSSFLVGRQLALKERTLASTFSIPETEYIDHGGAIPIRIKVCQVYFSISLHVHLCPLASIRVSRPVTTPLASSYCI